MLNNHDNRHYGDGGAIMCQKTKTTAHGLAFQFQWKSLPDRQFDL
jgi:hypothetical protein